MPEKKSRFAIAEKLIFRHVNFRLHVGNLKIHPTDEILCERK